MEEKTIKTTGYVILIWAILSPLIFFIIYGLISQGETTSLFDLVRGFIHNKNYAWLSPILKASAYFLAPLFLLFSIGIIKLKNWGRKGILILCYIILLINIIVLFGYFSSLFTADWDNIGPPLSPSKTMFIFSWIYSFIRLSILPTILIVLFSRKKTKEIFVK